MFREWDEGEPYLEGPGRREEVKWESVEKTHERKGSDV